MLNYLNTQIITPRMVRILTKEELLLEPNFAKKLKGSIFIYPTDTIYGIGCDATNDVLVKKLRSLKKRSDQPFSVIMPDKKIINEKCESDSSTKRWIDMLPGPYTLIMKVKNKFCSNSVNPRNNTVGVRIPNHWFTDIVKQMNVPVITTSVNINGEDFMTNLDDLSPEIKKGVDYIIYDGPLSGKPSTVVHLEGEEIEINAR
jgi:L-threonylcarbamoyladenylate synthase